MIEPSRGMRLCTGVLACLAVAVLALASPVLAGSGQPSPQQMGLQEPVTEIARAINWFHDVTNWIIIAIAVFVLALLVIVVVRFNERANPTPSSFTHNTTIEVVWTVVPLLILIGIGVPSFKLLFAQYTYPKPDLTIKAVGNAWFWEHEYPDLGLKVTSNMVRDEDVLKAELGAEEMKKRFGGIKDDLALGKAMYEAAKPMWTKLGEPRQLAVDDEIAVPVGKVVHVLVTSNDVIHSWTIPSFGSKTQAVPGRITSTWFKADKVGIYYGQCSVLCGKEHASMPIAIRVVPEAAFKGWTEAVKARDRKKAKAILKAATEDLAAAKVASVGN